MKKTLEIVKNHPVKTLLLTALVVALGLAGYIFWALGQAFVDPTCDAWRPDMTKDEKIRMILEDVNKEYKLSFFHNEAEGKVYHKNYPYTGADEILRRNPQCCRVVSSWNVNPEDPDTFDEHLSVGDEGLVYVRYSGRYRGDDGKVHEGIVTAYANLNNCK
jgi:hypothetical protein